MEFGHAQAPATLAKAVYTTFEDIIWDHVGVYFDDLFAKGDSAYTALKAIGLAFQRLEAVGLKLSLDKSRWLFQQVKAVGFVISQEGIRPDPARAEVFKNWPLPQDAAALRSYLGTVNYLRHMIPHYSEYVVTMYVLLAKCVHAYTLMRKEKAVRKGVVSQSKPAVPLDATTALTAAARSLSVTTTDTRPLTSPAGPPLEEADTEFFPKNKKKLHDQAPFFAHWRIQWSDEAKMAFGALNARIASGLFLAGFDPNLPITIESDASAYCIGSVLAQVHPRNSQVRPIMFHSRKLNPSEIKYSTIEKEALSAFEARQVFRFYIIGRPYTHIFDQGALKWTTFEMYKFSFDYDCSRT
jgi:hypothetical protein